MDRWASMDGRTLRVDEDFRSVVRSDWLIGKRSLHNRFQKIPPQSIQVRLPFLLLACSDGDAVDAVRFAAPILDPDVRLGFGGEIGKKPLLSYAADLSGELVGQPDGQGHQHRRLVACEAEDIHLVPSRDVLDAFFIQLHLVKAAVFIDGQFLKTCQDAAGSRIEVALSVPDRTDDPPRHIGEIHDGVGGEASGDEQNGRGNGTFRDHPRIGILLKEVIHDGITDLIAQFIRMASGYRFGCEDEITFHNSHLVRGSWSPHSRGAE